MSVKAALRKVAASRNPSSPIAAAIAQATRQAQIVRTHYGLSRMPSPHEVAAERSNLQRRANAGTLDTAQEDLAARLGISPVRPVS